MGFLARLRGEDARPDVARNGTPGPLDDFWYRLGVTRTEAGVDVTPDLALTLAPWWKGTRILAEGLASYTCHIYRTLDRGHRLDRGHPVDALVSRKPNGAMTAFEFWELCVATITLRGNFYAWIPRGGRGFVDSLWPIEPRSVRTSRLPDGSTQHLVTMRDGRRLPFGDSDVWHVKGMSLDGVTGISVVDQALQSVGAQVAAERYAARFFANGATASIAVIPDAPLDPETAYPAMKAAVANYLTGLKNASSAFVPPEKVAVEPIGIEPEKAQLLATRQFSDEQVEKWLNLPPATLSTVKTATYASAREFREQLYSITLRPLAERIESRIDGFVLVAPEVYFSKFNMDALLRADARTRSLIHAQGIQAGYKTRNEARLDEDEEPLDGLDEPLVPLYMTTNEGAEQSVDIAGQKAAVAVGRDAAAAGPPRLLRSQARLVQEAARLVRKEVATVGRLAQRHASDGEGWERAVRQFYDQHAHEVAATLHLPEPVALGYAGRQGLRLKARGLAALADAEWMVAPELAAMALEHERIADWLSHEPKETGDEE